MFNKKITSLLLTLALSVSMISADVFAEDIEENEPFVLMEKEVCSDESDLEDIQNTPQLLADSTNYAPYPKIEYGYSATVSVGTIRYISQVKTGSRFNAKYWPVSAFGGYNKPESECGTSSISMALSYVGVNKTPKDILEANNGYTVFGTWGAATHSTPTLTKGMDNYINGGGKYSPVVIHLKKYSGSGHYVVVVGKGSGSTYYILDPWECSVTTMTISGSTATYKKGGSIISDTIDKIYQWYNASAVHTCDYEMYEYTQEEHPHYRCYTCSICGKIHANKEQTSQSSNCAICNYPTKPVLTGMKESYEEGEGVRFIWDVTENTTHYNLYIFKENESGVWKVYEQYMGEESGFVRTLPAGNYQAMVQSCNFYFQTEDMKDIYTDSEKYTFTVKTFESEPQPQPDSDSPFVDISKENYYYDAVLWALDNNITQGKDATHFQPTESCTRAQVVTFLWRSQGCPKPQTTVNPFVDVPSGTYYTDAVLWAYENDITKGKDATHFQPKETVTRNQFVTFLWRAEGKPSPAINNPFEDVQDGTYYTDAVLWAFEKGITTGRDATHFQPAAKCQRCQVVTFLYRAYADK